MACNKQETNYVPTNEQVTFTISNPDNPFDYRGQDHNDMLKRFISDVITPQLSEMNHPGRSNSVDVYETVFEYFDIEQEGREMISAFHSTSHKSIAEFNEAELNLYLNRTMEYEQYFNIKAIVENTDIGLQEKIESLKEIESEISNSSLEGKSKEILLTAAAIGRYSLHLWAPEDIGGLGYFDELNINLPNGIDWWGVARTDIYGSCLAAFTTANPFIALGYGVASSAIDAFDGALS